MTFTTVPESRAGVNYPLVWVVYDANAIDPTKTDYKYVGELFVAGVKVYTERAYPRPSGAFGVFDFAAIIRNYVNPTFSPNIALSFTQFNIAHFRTADIEIKIREEYNGTVGSVVATSTAAQYYNTYSERPELTNPINSYTNKFASSRPYKTINLLSTTSAYFVPYFKTAAGTVSLNIVGASSISTTLTSTVDNSVLMVNIAPVLYTGAIGAAESYTATIGSETYFVNIICAGMLKNYTVHFLNKFGSFESMLFNKVSRRRNQIERKNYRQQPYRVNSSGVVSFSNGNYRHEQQVQFAGSISEKVRLQTDFINDDEYRWLSQLVASPIVYVEDAGVFYPATITDSSYEYKEHVVDSLTTLSIEVDFTGLINTQFR